MAMFAQAPGALPALCLMSMQYMLQCFSLKAKLSVVLSAHNSSHDVMRLHLPGSLW